MVSAFSRCSGQAFTPFVTRLTPLDVQAMKDDTDLVICDTSGRLHTNIGLMEELAKCKRSIGKRMPGAPHEVLLILDGTTGTPHLLQAPALLSLTIFCCIESPEQRMSLATLSHGCLIILLLHDVRLSGRPSSHVWRSQFIHV